MSYDDLDHYRESLRHIVRPDNPSERHDADSVRLSDYEALYLAETLIEYAAWSSEDAEEEEIALGLAEYINMVVRDEEKGVVHVFAHTDKAKKVIVDALGEFSQAERDIHAALEDRSTWDRQT